MRVIVGCEFSQVVTQAFRERGHEAFSCDLLPTEGNPEWHYQCDLLELLEREQFDLGIFHPECRYLNHAGVRWLYQGGRRWNKDGSENPRDPVRWALMERAAEFFNQVLAAPITRVAVENSEMHPHGLALVGCKADQIIQPWQFGHGEVKATHLWLRGLPALTPTSVVDGRTPRVHFESPGPNRWKNRSRTLQGVADAMADQWG